MVKLGCLMHCEGDPSIRYHWERSEGAVVRIGLVEGKWPLTSFGADLCLSTLGVVGVKEPIR